MSDTTPITARVEIVNDKGLHARASAKFVKTAAQFDAQIYVLKDESRVDAQSIMGLLMLAASKGTFIDIEAEGEQAQAAVEALVALVSDRFGEES
ncbi:MULTISPECIES: HPr family phosphocarrier protein [Asticcacaulis]|jgi:phosphocarrier protein|uniref:Phosphotransferase system, phosphocarrier protein HPr n=1 Tax=Asticcacaulis excentricus (strain ATCC 15261 / DSM 4724 / KCTC 12464 / NCIMB 9791 / VKM B-1370 / CB 48) TaxID=573065 RepID=E8RQ34_ASTEC|nr:MULTISPECIES: HPr family phosphocarrier protein [Asticcacaulis]ADU12091.1 Phosphotransferase system, phosphocarrier protein HPr [Asticcacaulis excentricus CB 48]MCA1936515.1 HPr family phosphocarrier protein [Asticcacaulis sp.]